MIFFRHFANCNDINTVKYIVRWIQELPKCCAHQVLTVYMAFFWTVLLRPQFKTIRYMGVYMCPGGGIPHLLIVLCCSEAIGIIIEIYIFNDIIHVHIHIQYHIPPIGNSQSLDPTPWVVSKKVHEFSIGKVSSNGYVFSMDAFLRTKVPKKGHVTNSHPESTPNNFQECDTTWSRSTSFRRRATSMSSVVSLLVNIVLKHEVPWKKPWSSIFGTTGIGIFMESRGGWKWFVKN